MTGLWRCNRTAFYARARGPQGDLVGDELRGQLEGRFPSESDTTEDPSVLLSRRAGNVIHCDRDALVAEARRAGCTLELVPMMGDFVTRGRRSCACRATARGSTASACGS